MTNYRDFPHTSYDEIRPTRYHDSCTGTDESGSNTGLLLAFSVIVVITGGLLMFSDGGASLIDEAAENRVGTTALPSATSIR